MKRIRNKKASRTSLRLKPAVFKDFSRATLKTDYSSYWKERAIVLVKKWESESWKVVQCHISFRTSQTAHRHNFLTAKNSSFGRLIWLRIEVTCFELCWFKVRPFRLRVIAMTGRSLAAYDRRPQPRIDNRKIECPCMLADFKLIALEREFRCDLNSCVRTQEI